MSKDILQTIVEYKQYELSVFKKQNDLRDMKMRAADAPPSVPFLKNFNNNDINIIAEIKKASPSAGVIRENFNPVEIAAIYQDHGAKCLSVLTDDKFFQGKLEYLDLVRARVALPILRKDFTTSDYHIYQARTHGADAVLLIAAILDDYQMADFHQLIIELGMTPLVEVHDQTETERVLQLNQLKLLGINNRNLKTFITSIKTTTDILANNKISVPVISESGLKEAQTLQDIKNKGVKGFLIGESLMKQENIGQALKDLLS